MRGTPKNSKNSFLFLSLVRKFLKGVCIILQLQIDKIRIIFFPYKNAFCRSPLHSALYKTLLARSLPLQGLVVVAKVENGNGPRRGSTRPSINYGLSCSQTQVTVLRREGVDSNVSLEEVSCRESHHAIIVNPLAIPLLPGGQVA